MRAHVFITNKNTFSVVRDNGFCGVGVEGIPANLEEIFAKSTGRPKEKYIGIIGDILGTRIGDIVFL